MVRTALNLRCTSTAEALNEFMQHLQRSHTNKNSDSARREWKHIKRLLEYPHTFQDCVDSYVIGDTSLPHAVLTALTASWGFTEEFQDRLGMQRLYATATSLYSREPETISTQQRLWLAKQCLVAANFPEVFPDSLATAADQTYKVAATTAPVRRVKQLHRYELGLALFLNIARVWPGQAGVLNSKEMRAAALEAAHLSRDLVAAVPDLHELQHADTLEQDIVQLLQPPIRVSCLLAKQLHSKFNLIDEGAAADDLLQSPSFLQLMLLLLDTQLKQYYAKQDGPQSSTDARVPSSDGSAAAPGTAEAMLAGDDHMQQYHLALQQSLGGLPPQVYQFGLTAAQEVHLTLPMLLKLLTCMLFDVGEHYMESDCDDLDFKLEEGYIVDHLCCSVLQPLVRVMVHLAVSSSKTGDPQTAAAAAELAMNAGYALKWWSCKIGFKREAAWKDAKQKGALGTLQQILVALQSLAEPETAALEASNNSQDHGPGSSQQRASSSSKAGSVHNGSSSAVLAGAAATHKHLPHLLLCLVEAGEHTSSIIANLQQTAPYEVGIAPAKYQQLLSAAAEECIRSLAAAAARGFISLQPERAMTLSKQALGWIQDESGIVGSQEEAYELIWCHPAWVRHVSSADEAPAAANDAAAPIQVELGAADLAAGLGGNSTATAEDAAAHEQAAAVAAAPKVGASTISNGGRRLFSVLLSHLKWLASLQDSTWSSRSSRAFACYMKAPSNSVRMFAAAAIGQVTINQQVPTAAQLPAAVPWLLLLVRTVLIDVRFAMRAALQLQQRWEGVQQRSEPTAAVPAAAGDESATAVAAGPSCSSPAADASSKGIQPVPRLKLLAEGVPAAQYLLRAMTRWIHALDVWLPFVEHWLPPFSKALESEQQQQQQHVVNITGPSASAQLLHVQLAHLLQQWQQELVPAAKQSRLLTSYLKALSRVWHTTERPQDFRQQLTADAAAVADAATVADAAVNGEKMSFQPLVTNEKYGMPLLQRIEAACEQLCALLPLPLCCNNPRCRNMCMASELQLVGGKACVCAGCQVARYCGQECQAAHWQAHKRVCKIIKKSQADAAQLLAATA